MPYQEMKTLTIDGTTYEIVDNAARSNITTLQALAGAPLVANTVSAMVDTTKVYVYTGSESGYTSGNWYYYSGSAWTSGGVYNSQGIGDGTITNEKLADSTVKLEKLHSEVIAAIGSGGSGTGLTEDIKQALLQCFGYVAWINDQGQTYYETLQSALYPPADLVSISAVYIQTGTVYDTDSLDVLKADLVVTAHWGDSSATTVTSYALSGTLTEGTSTITVSYGGKTTTFSVTVTYQDKSDMDGWTNGVAYTNLEIVQNEYCAQATGAFSHYDGWDRTGYVPCNGASSIVFPPVPQESGMVTSNNFFTENHVRISYFTLSKTDPTTITVPSNAYYFVISSDSAAFASCINAGIVPYE